MCQNRILARYVDSMTILRKLALKSQVWRVRITYGRLHELCSLNAALVPYLNVRLNMTVMRLQNTHGFLSSSLSSCSSTGPEWVARFGKFIHMLTMGRYDCVHTASHILRTCMHCNAQTDISLRLQLESNCVPVV